MFFSQRPVHTPLDHLTTLQGRVQRRRQRYTHLQHVDRILRVAVARRAGVLIGRLRAVQLPMRCILHLVVALIVALTSVAGLLSRGEQGLSGAIWDRQVVLLADLVAPVFPVESRDPYHGETPVLDSAFAAIDALPVPPVNPRLQMPFTTRAHSLIEAASMRNGPGVNYDEVGTLAQGSAVEVIGRFEDWFQVRAADGRLVWIAVELLDVNATAAEILPEVHDIPAPPPARVGLVTAPELSLRDGPGTNYVDMLTVSAGTQLDLLARYENWFQVQTAAGRVGWVSGDYLALETGVVERVEVVTGIPDPHPPLVGTIVARNVNLRGGPGTAYQRVGLLGAGTGLELLGYYRDWFQVRVPQGHVGWVSRELVDADSYVARRVPPAQDIPALPQPRPQPVSPPRASQPQVPAQPVAPAQPDPAPIRSEPAPVAPAPVEPAPTPVPPAPVVEPPPAPVVPASNVVDFAMQFVGANYAWGGASPSGFDCSGFTMYVYQQFGVHLPHSSAAQYSTRYGAIISNPAELLPGDLVFFANTYTTGVSHVGLYIGNGNVVQALSPGKGVGVASLHEAYWSEHYYSALRPYR